jgi:hypothetical protein
MFEEVEKLLEKMVEDHFDIDEDLTVEEVKGIAAEHIIQYLNQKYIY